MIGVGQDFPDCELVGVSSNNKFVNVDLGYSDRWRVIYFYPKDFTFICPTEIAAMDMISGEAEVIGISGDNEFCKLAWKESNPLIESISHTLCADLGLKLANELGIADELESVCQRATFILDPQGEIHHITVNALDTGRNAHETLRTLQALKAGGLTGCSWEVGEDFVA
jgi:peroxiredoxin (alkyl hydroperoxide reductase subunit C)